jgi:hypothetical protein
MRKRAVFYFIFLLLPCLAHAFHDALRFRVFLRGKDMDVRTSPDLSSASLARRQNQGIALDSTDYPVSKTYLNILREKGFLPVAQSRWMNTVVVAARDSSCIDTLKTLSLIHISEPTRPY